MAEATLKRDKIRNPGHIDDRRNSGKPLEASYLEFAGWQKSKKNSSRFRSRLLFSDYCDCQWPANEDAKIVRWPKRNVKHRKLEKLIQLLRSVAPSDRFGNLPEELPIENKRRICLKRNPRWRKQILIHFKCCLLPVSNDRHTIVPA